MQIWKKDFLSSCNTEYGPVKVKILAMVRQKAVDWSKKSHERKEYLTFNCQWLGYDFYGGEINLLEHQD
jgi:hypothetical protein